jgi:hypothetical protein
MPSEEKEKIRKIFPKNNIVVKMNPNNPPTETDLTSAEWQIIMQVDGKKTLQDIIRQSSLNEEENLRIFFTLHEKNLLEIVPESNIHDALAGEEFFKSLEGILIQIIGPVAVYVIDDVLWDMNESREKFLIGSIPALTESISGEILDDTKKVIFQKEMLDLIKAYEIS